MAIYLVQHGLAAKDEITNEKILSKEGRETTDFMAKLALTKKIKVSKIIHSSKIRAVETAEIFAKYLTTDKKTEAVEGLNPNDPPELFKEKLKNNDENMMIVGHLPFLEKLVAQLILSKNQPLIMKFQNSGIVCLERDANESWFIKWTLMPTVD